MHPFERDSRPRVRWWWLDGPFGEEDIAAQLSWLREKGFGGVELAWLAPLWSKSRARSPTNPEWLGEEFAGLLTLTKRACGERGLGCDFTFGSCRPFGGTCVGPGDASQTFAGPSRSLLRGSWEEPAWGRVLNHLSAEALRDYAASMARAFAGGLDRATSALFCDSWEIRKDDLWDPGLWDVFEERFGYDLRPFAAEGLEDAHARYDHRKLISEVVIREFYKAFTSVCHELGARSRVQCHGSPTELLSAYAAVDIPETEAVLFSPHFSRVPASAAALAGKPVVSCETFTCLYGFPSRDNPVPRELWKREQAADLKLLADGLFAQGVNQIVWHGMPYWSAARPDAAEFYASVHVGPGCAFDGELTAFNDYLRRVSDLMRRGRTCGRLAVYLPFEDQVLRGRLPRSLQVPGSQDFAEMRYVRVPEAAEGYAPLWVSGAFLADSEVRGGRLHCGGQTFEALYVDARFVDYATLVEMRRLAGEGLPVVLKRDPEEPGRLRHDDYGAVRDALRSLAVADLSETPARPPVRGGTLPWFWVREEGGATRLFFAPPKARGLRYPMTYGQSKADGVETVDVEIDVEGEYRPVSLRFAPYQSIVLRVERGEVVFEDVTYEPPPAVVG